jgi:signal transduction histidine kinase
MNFLLLFQLITCITIAILGVFVLARQPKSTAARFFFVFAQSTALWNLALFMAISMYGQPTLWGRLAISFGAFMPAGFILFLTEFPSKTLHHIRWRICVISTAIFFFIFSLTPIVVKEAWSVQSNHLEGDLGPGYIIFWIYYISVLVLAFTKALYKLHKTTTQPEKNQMRWVVSGFAVFFLPLIVTQFILPYLGVFTYNNLGPLFALPMIVCICYAIVKYKFLDIRFTVQRGLIYTIFTSIVIALYSGVLQIVNYSISSPKHTSVLSAAVIMILGIFLWPILQSYLQKVTDPIFYRHGYIYAEALKRLSYILQTTLSKEEIVTASSKELQYIFKARFVRFVDTHKACIPEDGFHVDTVVPIVFFDNTIAVIELGEKLSGEKYTARDMHLLETFALQASVALEKGRLFQKVQEHTEHLESIVEERTKEITQLHEEQKRAMVDISHNLQTPLTIIEGELQLFNQSSPQIATVRNSIQRVSSFIRQLLRLARFDSQTFVVEHSPLNIAGLVREQVEYFSVMAEEAGVTIRRTLPDTLIVHGNARLLGELLTNLVSNALAYKDPQKESFVHISLAENTDTVSLAVQDNGIGIPSQDIPSLFTRFYRSSRTKETLPGSGLGLAIVKGIAERHGAEVSVKSTLGEGSTFTITLPKA